MRSARQAAREHDRKIVAGVARQVESILLVLTVSPADAAGYGISWIARDSVRSASRKCDIRAPSRARSQMTPMSGKAISGLRRTLWINPSGRYSCTSEALRIER